MSIEKHIDFNQLTPDQFEELCFELIIKHGFTSITWRQGGADNGRDIEADFSISNGMLGILEKTVKLTTLFHHKVTTSFGSN